MVSMGHRGAVSTGPGLADTATSGARSHTGASASWRTGARSPASGTPACSDQPRSSGPYRTACGCCAVIRRFASARGHAGAGVPGPGAQAGCQVELTEVRSGGQDWWTLALEATGPACLRRTELEAAAAHVFAHALPGGLELGTEDSQSYAQWLSSGQVPSHAYA